MKHATLIALTLCCSTTASFAAAQPNCDNVDSGIVPLDLLQTDYLGFGDIVYEPGMYGSGRMTRPAEHHALGLEAAQRASQPRDAQGAPCEGAPGPDCQFAIAAVSMSNGTQEWSGNTPAGSDPDKGFINKVAAHPARHAYLVAVDLAKGGMLAECIAGHPDCTKPETFATYWTQHVPMRLEKYQATAEQVTIVWLKPGNHQEGNPDHVANMEIYVRDTLTLLRQTFPNVEMVYLNSRTYGGYGAPNKNVEPFAFEQGLALRNVLAAQIDGDPTLCTSGDGCETPWMDWGAYIWANGTTTPNASGIVWECDDFRDDDGQHPSLKGVDKVSDALIDHFASDEVAQQWFLAEPPDPSQGGAGQGGGGQGGQGEGTGGAGGDGDGAGSDPGDGAGTSDGGCQWAAGNGGGASWLWLAGLGLALAQRRRRRF